jgi:AcrR family transcriptional regulator
MGVQIRTVLDVATTVLLSSPHASLSEVAAAAGVSRTTLHSWFPTRQALLIALAQEAMDLVEDAFREARLDDGPARDALARAVTLTVPLGSRIEFLLRERSLDDDPQVTARYAALDEPLKRTVERGQRDGDLRADLPSWWLVTALNSAVYAAWETIADGRLAPRDAPRLVMTTVVDGAAPR